MGNFASRNLYESKSASDITSETYRVGDFQDNFTLQFIGSPSTTTIRGSNDEGRAETVTNWSTITCVIGAGLAGVTPGFRWLQCQRSETTAVQIGGWKRSI